MKRLLLAVMALVATTLSYAQVLTWTPPFPTESDPAQTLVITLDASKGNKGLFNFTPDTSVYVHIGVITNLSASRTDWKYVPFNWGTTPPAAHAMPIGNNKWTYTITGSLRTFFGITNPSETIQKIAILFRSANGSTKHTNSDGSDMYIPIYGTDLAASIFQPAREPRFIPTPEPQGWVVGTAFTVTAGANKNATLTLYHNGSLIGTQSNTQTITAGSTVTSNGNQQLVLVANDGINTRYDTVNIFAAPSVSPTAALPAGVRDGINYQPGDTSVILVLHAPGKNIVTVIGEFNNWIQDTGFIMKRTPDGKKFWLRIGGLAPGVEYAYQYNVDNSIRIADPYTQKILDPFNDQYITPATYPNLKPYPSGQQGIVSVLQTAMPAYSWSSSTFTRPDKRGLVIYELLVRDFVAAHDWNTIRDTLSYLKRLGVNAIQLMPFNEFEGNISWGYNSDFYFAVDKYYGPANTLKRFIDSAHKKGIAVIMDIALNHQFGSSPLVRLYWDAANNRPAADNPWFNPAPKHAFNVGYDMNHESLDTRYFTSRVVEHWLQEFRIDGFRWDLSKGFTQTQTCDNNGNNCDAGAMGNYDLSRINIWKRYYDTVQLKSPGAYHILEHFATNTEEKELSDYGMLLWGNLNYNYSQAAMGYVGNSNFEWVIHSVRGWTKPHVVGYMESHDEERVVYNTYNGNASGNYTVRDTATALKRMELDAAFLFTIPGPKMIWQFGELGYDYPINYCTNGTVNNNCRLDPKPIRWDYYNDARRRSVYNTYSKLLNLRADAKYKDLFLAGSVERSLAGGFKWLRILGDTSNIVVVGNFDMTAQSGTVIFPSAGTWYDYLNNNATIATTGGAQSITLQAGEFHVYTNRIVSTNITTAVTVVPSAGNKLEGRVFPNPSQGSFTLDFYLPQSGTANIELLNAAGQKTALPFHGFLPKGRQQRSFSGAALPRGLYYVRISSRGQQTILPLILQ